MSDVCSEPSAVLLDSAARHDAVAAGLVCVIAVLIAVQALEKDSLASGKGIELAPADVPVDIDT